MNKLIVSAKYLHRMIKPLGMSVNSTTVLPILENILFEVTEGVGSGYSLRATTTDLENVATCVIDIEAKEKFNFTVPYKLLLSALASIEEQPLVFEHNPKDQQVHIVGDGFKLRLQGEHSDNYPLSPKMDALIMQMKIKSKEIIPYFKRCLPFVSGDDLRPAMTGIFLCNWEGGLTVVATDAHKLYRKKMFPSDHLKKEKGIIVPRKAAWMMGDLFKDCDIEVSCNTTTMKVTSEKYTLYTRLIDTRFPDWPVVWPSAEPHKDLFFMKRKQLNTMLNLAKEFCNKSTYQTTFRISENSATVLAEDVDFSFGFEYNAPVYEHTYNNGDYDFAINSRFMQMCISIVKDDNIKIQYWAATKALIIDEDVLLMPLMLNT